VVFEGRFLDECPDEEGAWLYELTWVSEHGETATLTLSGGEPEAVPTTDTVQRCGPSPAEWTLTVTGAGGTASQSTDTSTPTPQ